jgi:hypothetical protein
VPDKPSFLIRGLADLRKRCNQLGLKLKSDKEMGTTDKVAKNLYKQQTEWLRDTSTVRRHSVWWQIYEPAYDMSLDAGLRDGLTENQAKKRARIQAEEAVIKAFPDEVTTTRAVRKALSHMHD